jgi:membrane-associated phospholipid phosphatase
MHDHGLLLEHGWSFPSGHASGAVATYGMLAYVLTRLLPERWHAAILATAAVIALSTGFSRVFLQVHFLSDVIAGFACGLAWLTLCIAGVEVSQRSSMRA